jgi:hypothetical protein
MNTVMEQPNLARENALAAWGDVVANGVPKAAMAVDEAYQKEQDFKFDLMKDDINSSAREALDGCKDDLNKQDPKDLYLNGDITTYMQDYENRMQKAREKSTGKLKGGLKRRADRYWDSITSVNKDVAKQIYDKAQKEAGAMLIGQKVGEAVQNGNEQAAIEAIDEGVRMGAILPKDRDNEVAEAKKQIYNNQTQAILADRGVVFNNALDMIHQGQLTEEDIDSLDILGIMPERGINTDLRNQLKKELKDQNEKQDLIDKKNLDDEVAGVVSSAMDEMQYMTQAEREEFIAGKQIEWQKAYPDRRDKMIDPLSDYNTWLDKAEKTRAEKQKKVDPETEQMILGDARNYITGSSPAQGKAYITALIGSLSSDGQKQLNDYYNGYWDARKKDISDKQADYFNKTIMPAIRNGEITSRQQIENDPNLEDWHEIGVPSYMEKALTLFDNVHGESGKTGKAGSKTGGGSTSGNLTSLLKECTNPYASDGERENALLNFATNPNTWHLTTDPEYEKLWADVKNHHFPTDPSVSRMAEQGQKRIDELRDAGKGKEADELEEAYVNFFHTLAQESWTKMEKDESGNMVERPLSFKERRDKLDNAEKRFGEIIASKDLSKVYDFTFNANPAKFDIKGNEGDYNLVGNGDYKRIKEKAVDSINLLGSYGRAVDSRTILRKYEQLYMDNAGIKGLDGYTYEYQEIIKPVKKKDGSMGTEKTYGMVFVSPDQNTLYYIADNEKGNLNIFEAHKTTGDKFTFERYVPETVQEILDAKKEKKPYPTSSSISEAVRNPDANVYEATNSEENVKQLKKLQDKGKAKLKNWYEGQWEDWRNKAGENK